jgi:Fe-S-cluster containining protein
MIYLVQSCISIDELGEVRAICGGWCCYKLNFSEFPNGRWHSKPCDYLKEGVCSCYEDRPTACEGSPFFDGGPQLYPSNKFITPWCAYRREVLDYRGTQYEILETGEACIEQYSRQGLDDFERWTERRFYKKRTIFYSTSRQTD